MWVKPFRLFDFAVYAANSRHKPSVTNQPCDTLFCLSWIFDGPAVSLAQIKSKATTANGTGIPLLIFQWSPFVPLTSFRGGVQIWAAKLGRQVGDGVGEPFPYPTFRDARLVRISLGSTGCDPHTRKTPRPPFGVRRFSWRNPPSLWSGKPVMPRPGPTDTPWDPPCRMKFCGGINPCPSLGGV